VKPLAGQLDLAAVREQFPGLEREVHGKRLVYLDSAATAQRCLASLTAMDEYHRSYNANVHRGLYTMSEEATVAYETARQRIATFLGVTDANQIVFTRGTTEAVNLVARSFLAPRLVEDDEILVTTMEHHSNLVPWQLIAAEKGARVVAARVDARGDLDLDDFRSKLGPRTKMVSVSHVSNVLGTINPVSDLIALAREHGVPVMIDGAQSAPHMHLELDALGADFYAFSGHKLYGPTGSGALYGRSEHLASMPPFLGGGDMIREVAIEKSTYADPPQRFEAGTPNIAAMIGLGAAVNFVADLDPDAVAIHEASLLELGLSHLSEIEGLRILGAPRERVAVFCFEITGLSSQDVSTLLDYEGVALRSGHHCAMPLMQELGVTGCLRVSFAPYNSSDDVEVLVAALHKVCRVLRG
jgi:cysteine desulfurase/selenocysteine lyase